MAEIVCPHCKPSFDMHHAASLVTRAAAMAELATTGALVGAEIGPIGKPVDGIVGAVFGGVTAGCSPTSPRRPTCGKIVKMQAPPSPLPPEPQRSLVITPRQVVPAPPPALLIVILPWVH